MDNIQALREFAVKHDLLLVKLDSGRQEVTDHDRTVVFAWGTTADLFVVDENSLEHRVTCEELLKSEV